MIALWFEGRRLRLAGLLAASIGLSALSGCGSKGGNDEAKTDDPPPPAADGPEAAPESPPAVAGKDKGEEAAPAPGGEAVAGKDAEKDEGKSGKVDFNDNEEMLKLARGSASSPPAGSAPGSPAPPAPGANAAPSPRPNAAPAPGANAAPSPGANAAPPAGVPGPGGMMGPGNKNMVGPRDGNGGRPGAPPGGPAAPGNTGASILGDDTPAGNRGGGSVAGGGGGSTKAPDFKNPVAGAKTFLAALKAKDVELLSEAVALRSVTEASEDHKELFRAIREKVLDPDKLDEMAAAFEGMTVQDTNTAKSSGLLGVIIGKTKGQDRIAWTLTMRREKAGWKLLDYGGHRIFKGNSNGRPKK